jgi:F-type H+-transporting ATPase subunit gamma
MTRRRNLEHHRHSLEEIRDIMNSMKTLAYMETRKLTRFLDAQHAVVHSITEVAADFLSFHPDIMPEVKQTPPVYLLIGTERGFCGDFNHALLKSLESTLQAHPRDNLMLIAVGRKLYTLLEEDARLVASMEGPSVVEEVTAVLNQVVSELSTLQAEHGVLTVYCLYHNSKGGILLRKLLPPFQDLLHKPPCFSHPPLLHQSPKEFLVELTDYYLFAALHEMLYTSLMEENQHRVAHLEGAVRHLDDTSAELARQCNALRQEEIIEEIEVILLSAASLGEQPGKRDYGVRKHD